MGKLIRVIHRSSGTVIAQGPRGWGILPFEGNFYIRKRYLKGGKFRMNGLPGLCFYKFLYIWMDLHLEDGTRVKNLGWQYVLPNPLFFFVAYRVGIPQHHPAIKIEEIEEIEEDIEQAQLPTKSD